MNERIAGGRPVAWEDAGRQIAPILGAYSAIMVSSIDPLLAAHAALGIARAEAARRRVVVGDLVGDLPPLTALVTDDDSHGISDSILYGVSFSRIGRPVKGADNLFVMPSGSEPVLSEDIVGSPRWKRLAATFTEAGALLLLVTRSDSPGLGALADQLDGAVVVRDSDIPGAPSALILARIPAPTRTLKVPFLRDVDVTALHANRRRVWGAVAAVAALIAALSAGFLISRDRDASEPPVATDSLPAPAPAATVVAPPLDSLLMAQPANAADSPSAAAFAVELLVANTPEGANFVLRRDNASLPSATLAPTSIGTERATWYKVIAGAYTRRDQADSLLRALRASRVLNDSAGSVLRVPLALLVDSVSSQGGMDNAIDIAVRKYTAQRLPVYALMQDDGDAKLYAGAFDSAANAGELLKTLREAGVQPALVYRTGRTP